MDVLTKECCERLKKSMKELKVTGGSLSIALGLSKSAFGNYVNGLRMPNADIFYEMCRILNITVEWAMTGDGEQHPGEGSKLPNEEEELLANFRQLSYEQQAVIKGRMYEFLLTKEARDGQK